ncbi:MAG: hypothetical protein Q8S55_22965 [Methylococcaceae bacterium]|nr:hypothetical protein [Methylococcaceae bacterium]
MGQALWDNHSYSKNAASLNLTAATKTVLEEFNVTIQRNSQK